MVDRSCSLLLLLALQCLPSTIAHASLANAMSVPLPGVGDPSRSDSIDLLHTRLELDLTNTSNGIISGRAAIAFTPKVEGITTLVLDLLQLTTDSVTTEEGQLPFFQAGEALTISLPGTFGSSDTLDLTIHYHGNPVTDPSGFGGFYTLPNYQYDLGVAFDAVPHSFGRSWFPCFDNFVERCTFEFIVHTSNGRSVYANGERMNVTELPNGERITTWTIAEPIPSYLASVAAGNYEALLDTFPSTAGNNVPVTLVALPSDTADMRSSFAHLRNAFDTYEAWFGPYRWERVGYVLTSAGAMEHPTNICYPDFAADGSLGNERLMAHELAHHWFGDLITCQRAEEMYINEGFADYCSYLFIEDLYGTEPYMELVRSNHHDMVSKAHLLDHGWYALDDVPQAYTYGEHSYKKGADIVHTLRSYLGDSLFREGFTHVLANNAYSDMSSAELRDSLAEATGKDLSHFFDDWIFQPGWAAFEVDSFQVVPDGDQFNVQVFLEQKTRGPATLYSHVPVTITGVSTTGTKQDTIIELSGEFPTIDIQLPFVPAAIRINNDDRIALAITAEERTIADVGPENIQLADIIFVVNVLPEPVQLRVEEYWVAADSNTDPSPYIVSPDRWWRFEGMQQATETSITTRFSFDGRPTSNTAFDTELIEQVGAANFTEDSLVLLHRIDAHHPWTPVTDVTLNFLGSHTDGYARLETNYISAGDFAYGLRDGAVGMHGLEGENEGWRFFPDPADDHVTVTAPEGTWSNGDRIIVRDVQGRVLIDQTVSGTTTLLDISKTPTQTVVLALRHRSPHKDILLGQLVITR